MYHSVSEKALLEQLECGTYGASTNLLSTLLLAPYKFKKTVVFGPCPRGG